MALTSTGLVLGSHRLDGGGLRPGATGGSGSMAALSAVIRSVGAQPSVRRGLVFTVASQPLI